MGIEAARILAMCSFFQQRQARAKSERYVANSEVLDSPSRVIRPSVEARVLTAEGECGKHWGLIPFWSKTAKLRYATFNARAESLTEKPSYRDAWRRSQRCLIPARNYSEWCEVDGKKRRHNIGLADGGDLMIAGLWSDWEYGEASRPTFTMVTTTALDQIRWLHERSPRLLRPDEQDVWLHGAADECRELLLPQDPGQLRVELARD